MHTNGFMVLELLGREELQVKAHKMGTVFQLFGRKGKELYLSAAQNLSYRTHFLGSKYGAAYVILSCNFRWQFHSYDLINVCIAAQNLTTASVHIHLHVVRGGGFPKTSNLFDTDWEHTALEPHS